MIKTQTKPCNNCRNWDGCGGKVYYKMSEISYCRYQSIFIIEHFFRVVGDQIIVERDSWPREESDSGYTEAPRTGHTSISANAPYEKPCQIVAELHYRIERTGQDGRELIMLIRDEAGLSTAARNSLNYISGFKRKREDYKRWLRYRKQTVKWS